MGVKVMGVKEIEKAIVQLPAKDLDKQAGWLDDYRAKMWDKQIKEDLEAGRDAQVAGLVDGDFAGHGCVGEAQGGRSGRRPASSHDRGETSRHLPRRRRRLSYPLSLCEARWFSRSLWKRCLSSLLAASLRPP